MLRRKHKKTDNHSSNGSFSYSRVESSVRSDSLQEENEVLSSSIDVDVDEKPAHASWNVDDKKIFEDQLEALQDQLIATMMENQKLGLYHVYSHLGSFFSCLLQRNKFR